MPRTKSSLSHKVIDQQKAKEFKSFRLERLNFKFPVASPVWIKAYQLAINPKQWEDYLFYKTSPQTVGRYARGAYEAFVYALHMLYKLEWDSKHKIPGYHRETSDVKNYIKIFGFFLWELEKLIIATHAKGSPFYHPSLWFLLVFREMLDESIADSEIDYLPLNNHVERHRKRLKLLKEFQSLFEEIAEIFPYSHQLFYQACKLAEQSNQFKKNYFDNFYNAYSKMINFWEENPSGKGIWHFRDDLYSIGQGGGKILIP